MINFNDFLMPKGEDAAINPWESSYDRYGRGASPNKALLFEALSNTISPGSISDRIPVSEMIRKNNFLINPKFLSHEYEGSGSVFQGGPSKGRMVLSTQRPWQDMLREILQHEQIHRKSGGMGGVDRFAPMNSKYERFLSSLDPMDQNPQERMAYMLDRKLSAPHRYYYPGDLQKSMPAYLSDWNYSQR